METAPVYLNAPLLTTLLIEVVKYALRHWVFKNPDFEFAPIFYQSTIPFFNLVFAILLGLAGWGDPVAFTWESLLNWALSIVVTLVLYQMGIKPLKDYREQYTFRHN